jgi:hypothetical protein
VFELRGVAAFDVAQGGVAESDDIKHKTGIRTETIWVGWVGVRAGNERFDDAFVAQGFKAHEVPAAHKLEGKGRSEADGTMWVGAAWRGAHCLQPARSR